MLRGCLLVVLGAFLLPFLLVGVVIFFAALVELFVAVFWVAIFYLPVVLLCVVYLWLFEALAGDSCENCKVQEEPEEVVRI